MGGLGGGVGSVRGEGGVYLVELLGLYVGFLGKVGACIFEFPLLPALSALAAVPADEFLGGETGAQRRNHASPR